MLSQDQLKEIIAENDSLQVQLEEVNTILSIREEELFILKEKASMAVELQSRLDIQLEELHSMQNQIGQKEQQAEGAEERELELQQELTEAARLQQQYNDLTQQYTYQQAQFIDIQEQLSALKQRNLLLQQIAGKMGEVESHLANTVMERDGLLARIAVLEEIALKQDVGTGK